MKRFSCKTQFLRVKNYLKCNSNNASKKKVPFTSQFKVTCAGMC